MKKQSKKKAKTPPCPPAEAVPSTASPAGDTAFVPGQTKLEFAYYGPQGTAKGYNSGLLVQHAMPLDGDSRTYVYSLRSGPHERRTLAELTVKALLGPCTVAIKFGETTTLQTNDTVVIPAGSTFTFATTAKAVLLVTSLGDPGLGDEGNEEEEGGSEEE